MVELAAGDFHLSPLPSDSAFASMRAASAGSSRSVRSVGEGAGRATHLCWPLAPTPSCSRPGTPAPSEIMGGESSEGFSRRGPSQHDTLSGQGVAFVSHMGGDARRSQNSLIGGGVSNAPSAVTMTIGCSLERFKRALAALCSARMNACRASREATSFPRPSLSRLRSDHAIHISSRRLRVPASAASLTCSES